MNHIATYKKTALRLFGALVLVAVTAFNSGAQINVLSALNGGDASHGPAGGPAPGYGPNQYIDGNIPPYANLATADFGYVNSGGWIKMFKANPTVPPVPIPFTFNKVVFHKGDRPMGKCEIQVWDVATNDYITIHNYENYINNVADSALFPTTYSTDTIRFNAIVSSAGILNPTFREIQVWELAPCGGVPSPPFNNIQASTYQSQVPTTANMTVCLGVTVWLAALGDFYSTGHGYQWQINKAGAGWQDIPGANGPGYAFHANYNAQFRVVDTCIATGLFATSNTIGVNISASPAYQTVPYFQGFETWQTSCAVTATTPPALPNINDIPGPGWTNSPAQWNSSWRRYNAGTPAVVNEASWSTLSAGIGGITAAGWPEGISAARFHSSVAGASVPGNLDLYLNLANPVGDKQVYFYMRNNFPAGGDSLLVSFSVDSGSTWTRIGGWDTTLTWASGRRSIPLATNSPTTILRFQGARSNFSENSDIFLDSLYIVGPCAGTPSAGYINLTSPQAPCPGSIFSLNPIGTTMAGGLVYTWEQSTNGGASFDPVPPGYGSGSNGLNFITPSLYDTVHYRLKVQCGASGTPVYSNTIVYNVAEPQYAAIPYSQSFETWVNKCSNNDVPESANSDINFTNTPATGNNSWRRHDQGGVPSTSPPWTSPNNGQYWSSSIPEAMHGAKAARFHSAATTTGVTGNLDLLVDASTSAGSKEVSFYYINPGGNDSLRIFFSKNGGGSFTRLAGWASTGGWVYRTVLVPSDSAKTIIRFQGFSEFGGSDLAIDSVRVIPPCTGAPFAGTISNASPCPGVNFTIQLQGTSIAASLTYQWQQSTNNSVWNNIPGATTTVYSTNIAAPVYYRVIVTCTNTGLTDTTAVQLITPASFYYCYCASFATATSGSDIGRFEVQRLPGGTTLFANGAPLPVANNNNASANQSYTNFNNLPPIKLSRDSSYRLMVTQINSASYVNTTVGVWIDTSMNGIFEPNELMLLKWPAANTTPPQMVDSSLTIPGTARLGITGLRIVMEQGINPALVPCGPYGSGETEDYLVEITYPPCDGPTNAGTAFISDTASCVGYIVTVVDTTHERQRSGISWLWEYSPDGNSWAVLPGTQNKDTVEHVMTGPTYFRLRMICNRMDIFFDTTYSNVVSVSIGDPWACYCFSQSNGGSADSSDIGEFEIVGKLHVAVNPIPPGSGPHLQNPAAFRRRTDYTNLPVTHLWTDSTYTFKVFHIMRGVAHHDAKVTVFMDFNNDYKYNVTPTYSERIYTGYTTQSNFLLTDTVTIPFWAITGVKTGMRLIINNDINPNVPSDSACGTYTSGETEDFVVMFHSALDVPHLGNISRLLLYPNPSEGRFSLSFAAHKPVGQAIVTVTNLTGQTVLQNQYSNAGKEFVAELDLTGMPRGVYLVELKADNEKLIRKVVVQ